MRVQIAEGDVAVLSDDYFEGLIDEKAYSEEFKSAPSRRNTSGMLFVANAAQE